MSSNKTQPTNQATKLGKQKKKSPLPMREGVSASRVWLPKAGASKSRTETHGERETIFY